MNQKLRVMTTAAALVLVLPGAAIAIAQGDQQSTAVKKGAVLQQPAVVQQAPAATVGPVSRPGNWGGSLAPQGVISSLLTVNECEGLGGKVNDVKTSACASGKACYTANTDGVIKAVCIDNKVN
jgi:hypothetical protein